MNLIEAFEISENEVISIVGGGGKTTLMFALALELVQYHKVITTTTTRIGAGEPDKFDSSLLLEEDDRILVSTLPENLLNYAHLTVVRQISPEKDKLLGYPPEVIDRIAKMGLVDIIVEADGARGKPIKAPNAAEPIIPHSSTLVIPVVGMDALGAKLNEDNAFRPEIISQLTGLISGEPITEEAIATLLTHPQGIAKGTPSSARIIPLLNKVDESNISQARSIARKVLAKEKRIQRVVLGQIQGKEPIIEVIS